MSISLLLQEWEQVSPVTNKSLAGVRLELDDETQTIVQNLSEAGKLKITELAKGIAVEATSYVGRIGIGDLQISIRPKIEITALLHLLQYTYGLRQLDFFPTVEYENEAWSFQDILISQLVAEVSELVMRGLHRKYVRREEALLSPRGRIAVQTIANQGGIFRASLPCIHYLRLEDCLINQVLLQGVLLGAQLANDDMLRTKLQLLAHFHLSDISPIDLHQQTLKRLRSEMDRLTAAYIPAITLIEMLFAGQGMSMDESHPELRLPGFLFDMNIFFQELLSRFLSEHLQEYTIQTQFEIEGMLTYVNNPRRRMNPKPRPDYVVKKGRKVVAILDAKYRDLWRNDLPPHMLYQLVMYALSQDTCNSATILYPTTQPEAQEAKMEVRVPRYGTGRAYIILRPVDLLKLEELIIDSKTRNNERERKDFARWLAFGDD